MPRQNLTIKSFLGRYNILSLVVLAAADIPGIIDPTVLGWFASLGVAVVAAGIIFINELYSDKKVFESGIDAVIAWFLLAIPGPFAGPIILGAKLISEK